MKNKGGNIPLTTDMIVLDASWVTHNEQNIANLASQVSPRISTSCVLQLIFYATIVVARV
jgi:hypothetical protein